MAGTGLAYGSEPRDKFNSAGKKEPIFFLTSSVDCTRVLINKFREQRASCEVDALADINSLPPPPSVKGTSLWQSLGACSLKRLNCQNALYFACFLGYMT